MRGHLFSLSTAASENLLVGSGGVKKKREGKTAK